MARRIELEPSLDNKDMSLQDPRVVAIPHTI